MKRKGGGTTGARNSRVRYPVSSKKTWRWNVRRILQTILVLLIAGLFFLEAYFIHHDSFSPELRVEKPEIRQDEPSNRSASIRHDHDNVSTNATGNHIRQLPLWIQNYIHWHKEIRSQFPGNELFENPKAPKLLIRTCLGLCGGLHDRLGQLPWDLYLANQTNRILLLHWHRPVPIENFLVPNEFDWTVPRSVPDFFPKGNSPRVDQVGMKRFRRVVVDMFEGYNADRPDDIFFQQHLDKAIRRANEGEYKDTRVLRHRILGHLREDVLESRLHSLGESDMIHSTSSFGNIFHAFFRPSEPIQRELDGVMNQLGLLPQRYSAVHCRVRHPKAFDAGNVVIGKDGEHKADKTGLPWEGEQRQFAIETAIRAIKCAKHLTSQETEPIYFFSDSNDLVRYMSHELNSPSFVKGNQSIFEESRVDKLALQVVQSSNVLSREASHPNAHIDLQKGKKSYEYYSTFVDLFLAIQARCVTFGIGFYAVFATKISGTNCTLLYQQENWGVNGRKHGTTDFCVLPED